MKLAKMPDGSCEIYGPVIQGEGADIGLPVFFVRFAGCNLYCKWCDTPYTWYYEGSDHEHVYSDKVNRSDYEIEITPEQVVEKILALKGDSEIRNVIFSGGEPLLQQKQIIEISKLLIEESPKWYLSIETNGTIKLTEGLGKLLNTINCSPKLESSGCLEKHRNKPKSINSYVEQAPSFFKFVAGIETFDHDIAEIENWQMENNISDNSIYVMPEGIEKDQIIAGTLFLEQNLKKNWRVTSRLHVLLHGDKRAV
jgi:organic radical activating enzyme